MVMKKKKTKQSGIRTLTSKGAYRCGDDTRVKILKSAINVFAELGLQAATTRQVAARAKVNLAALRYYFGCKEDLYRACAEYIADDFAINSHPAFGRIAMFDVSANLTRDEMIDLLEEYLVSHIEALDAGKGYYDFTERATYEHSIAYDVIYERIFSKVIDTVHMFFCRLTGCSPDNIESRIALFSLIGAALGFRNMRPTVLRSLGWEDYKGNLFVLLKSNLREQLLCTIDRFSAPNRVYQSQPEAMVEFAQNGMDSSAKSSG
jgi:AcrR family transcriptional regulator